MLYGDWDTSKAYVIWLGFRGSRLQLILADPGHVRVDGACRRELHGPSAGIYPDGGGASVRHRSEVISVVGIFLVFMRNQLFEKILSQKK
jgi:hypothetical protein